MNNTDRADFAIAHVTENLDTYAVGVNERRLAAYYEHNLGVRKTAGAERLVLLALVRALVGLVAAYATATKLRAAYVEIKAEEGAEADATKGAAYVAACATETFNRAALEVRACRYALDHGFRLGAARVAIAAAEAVVDGEG